MIWINGLEATLPNLWLSQPVTFLAKRYRRMVRCDPRHVAVDYFVDSFCNGQPIIAVGFIVYAAAPVTSSMKRCARLSALRHRAAVIAARVWLGWEQLILDFSLRDER